MAFGFLKGKSSGRSGCRHHKITASTMAICTIGDTVSRIRVAVKSRAGPISIARPVWEPTVDLEDGLERVLDWWKNRLVA